ncbi:MAG: DNA repair protein RecO [Candidatus Gottesmanbacteria bacterium]
MRTYKTEGIILKRSNFGEADRLLTIFTKHYGKIHVRAPGARKTLSRKAAHLEVFNLSTIFLVQGKTLDILTEAQTISNFGNLKKELQKIATAYYMCELVDGLCPERQENREVFELLTEKLTNLEIINISSPINTREQYSNQLLWILGYLPRTKMLKGEDVESFIENILERKLKSRKLLRKIEE